MWEIGYSNRNNMKIMNNTFKAIPNWNWEFGNTAMEMKDYTGDFQKETSRIKIHILFS